MAHVSFRDPIDPLTHDLIRHKARRLIGRAGLREQDREDLEQELTCRLLARLPAFDPRKGRHAAFVRLVIARIADNLLRDRLARRRDHRHTRSLEAPVRGDDELVRLAQAITRSHHDDRRGRHPRPDPELAQLAGDLGVVLSVLPPKLRDLAERLMRQSVAAAARELGVPRTTLYGDIRRLRRHFERAGLRDYL